LSETGKLEKEANDKDKAIHKLIKEKEQYEFELANNSTKKANISTSAKQS
jgi:hypothetical protein